VNVADEKGRLGFLKGKFFLTADLRSEHREEARRERSLTIYSPVIR
jgi:hypothetical protein